MGSAPLPGGASPARAAPFQEPQPRQSATLPGRCDFQVSHGFSLFSHVFLCLPMFFHVFYTFFPCFPMLFMFSHVTPCFSTFFPYFPIFSHPISTPSHTHTPFSGGLQWVFSAGRLWLGSAAGPGPGSPGLGIALTQCHAISSSANWAAGVETPCVGISCWGWELQSWVSTMRLPKQAPNPAFLVPWFNGEGHDG